MKPFNPDFTLRYTSSQASTLEPCTTPYRSHDIEHTIPSTELIDLTHPQHDDLLATFSPTSLNSDITYSTVINSPSSTEQYESVTTSSQPSSVVCTTAKPSKLKRKREQSSDGAILDPRCKAIRIPRLVNLNFSLDKDKQLKVSPWSKAILVRMKSRPDEVVIDLRYTFVKLIDQDIHCCIAAICAKMGIPYTKGMSVSWLNSETLLRGPFNHEFLQSMADMQDFVIDIVKIGVCGDVGLLLEM